MNTVPESVYLSAVNGRKDMREALRESRESQKATRDSALEEAALYHDRAAAECEAIAKVNRDNDLGASCLTHAADHRIAADNIRAMKSGGTLPPMANTGGSD